MHFFKGFQAFKAFCSFDAPFSSVIKKYRGFATDYYSLVATNAVFAELKQFKAIYWGNTHTHTLTDYSTLAMRPHTAMLKTDSFLIGNYLITCYELGGYLILSSYKIIPH